jgi:hypothetical protein
MSTPNPLTNEPTPNSQSIGSWARDSRWELGVEHFFSGSEQRSEQQ